jgi:hypothetical protein
VTSAPATDSATTALVPAFDFDQVEIELRNDPKLDLSDVLAKLATLPPVDPAKPVKTATAIELVTDSLMAAITEIPNVFGQVKPPKTRRMLNSTELVELRAEKTQIDIAEKALKKRKEEIHKMVSVHFDVVAERQRKIDPQKTPTNKDGHYLLASAGNPEKALVKDGEKHFTREKAKDKVEWSMDALLDLLETGQITRTEFLSMTSQTRVIDQDKISRLLTLKSKAQRTRQIIQKISVVKYGALSIHLR